MASDRSNQGNSFQRLLAQTPVSSLPTPKGEVVVITSDCSPYDGFKTLLTHNILSAPVLDKSSGKYTGFLDMRDLVSFVVYIDDDQISDCPNDLKEIVLHGCKLFKAPVEGVTCTYLSRRNPFHAVHHSDSLLEACNILAKGVHRVPVLNEQGQVINIISQSSIINFIYTHRTELKSSLRKTIGDIGIGSRPVISVTKDSTAIETFRLMDNKKISGVAVVDSQGSLVGNTSSSDLKLFIKTLSLEILHEPIMQFLNTIRQESIDIRTPTISISPRDTLETLIGKLASTKVHRIFVADDQHGYKPTAVVSITDILRYINSIHE